MLVLVESQGIGGTLFWAVTEGVGSAHEDGLIYSKDMRIRYCMVVDMVLELCTGASVYGNWSLGSVRLVAAGCVPGKLLGVNMSNGRVRSAGYPH
jgi:hypothetical protein